MNSSATFWLVSTYLKAGCLHPQRLSIDSMAPWAHGGGREICFVHEEAQEVTFHTLHIFIYPHRSLWEALGYAQATAFRETAHVVLVVLELSFSEVATAASWGG